MNSIEMPNYIIWYDCNMNLLIRKCQVNAIHVHVYVIKVQREYKLNSFGGLEGVVPIAICYYSCIDEYNLKFGNCPSLGTSQSTKLIVMSTPILIVCKNARVYYAVKLEHFEY